ncbi:MAG: hypothetical protein FH751_10745 [Firmicutes bacterium]|nr:hypothetical protein [Bacillota bacterium]
MKSGEEIIGEILKFFEVGFYDQRYYDIYITNKKLILVWMGESYKPWMLRVDPGQNKRKDFSDLNVKDIIKHHENNIIIPFKDIIKFDIKKKSFLKNCCITIKTKKNKIKLYSKDKSIDYIKHYKLLTKYLDEKVSLN